MPRAPGLGPRRLAAGAVDYCIVALYVGLLTLGGSLARSLELSTGRITGPIRRAVAHLIGFSVLTLPVTVALAGTDAGPRGASPGKRLLGLQVATRIGVPLPFVRSLLRSSLKVALPWELAHTAIWRFLGWPARSDDALAKRLLLASYLVAGTYLLSLFVGSGRTPYDYASGATVRITTALAPHEAEARPHRR
jgi:uncharacterized RDD family membrane protein YckC